MTDEKEELKPCPWCGNPPVLRLRKFKGGWRISCYGTGCQMHPWVERKTKEASIKAWNTRKT